MKALKILEILVAFPTVSSSSNLDLMAWVAGYLDRYGVKSHLVPNEDGTKTNLYATIGPATAGGIILSGHTDVVPVEGQDWHSAPFETVIKDGRVYGRGTCDMKGFLAIVLAAVPAMVAADLKRPIHLAFTYDEEVGCLGAPPLIAELVKVLPPVDAVFVGEPTSMKVIENHKGMVTGSVMITGRDAHSSMPHLGVDANLAAHHWMSEILKLGASLASKRQPGSTFEPPISTINIGVLSGGNAVNIVAGKCHIGWSLRVMPTDDAAEIIAEIQRATAKVDFALKAQDGNCGATLVIHTEVPSFKVEPTPTAANLCRSFTGENNKDQVVSFATEAGQFQLAGYSVAVCGPGSIEQAHKPNEFIALSEMDRCAEFLTMAISRQS